MKLSKRSKLYISIIVIILYWLYVFFIKSQSTPIQPSNLVDFMTRVIGIKFIFLIIIYLLLHLEGDSRNQLGFTGDGLSKQIISGISFGLGIWIVIHLMINPTISALNPYPTKGGLSMAAFMKNTSDIFLWIPFVVFSGGFVEELVRIFQLTRFEKWLGKHGLYVALLISSLVFGLGHLYQGLNTAIGTGITGLMFGIVYLRKRSAIEAMTCHAIFDVTSVIVGFITNQ